MTATPPPAGPSAPVPHARTVWSVLWGRQAFEPGEDRDAAPAGRGRVSEAPRWSWRHGVDHGAWSLLVGWLVLVMLLVPALAASDGPADVFAAVAVVLVVGGTYVAAAWTAEAPVPVRFGHLALFSALVLAGTGWLAGSFAFAMTPYIAVLTAHLVPWRYARVLVPVAGTTGIVVGAFTTNWYAIVLSVLAIGMGLLLGSGLENARLGRRLQRSEARVATLAVAAERERIGRDLHDILGHSLTAVAVKAGLASRLADLDPEATREQLREIEQVARQALADVRATAGGYREVRLATEIAGALSVLEAGGVRCTASTALPTMSDATSEFLGYVVREAVTNVVRHAAADTVDIVVDVEQSGDGDSLVRVVVADDGRGRVGPGAGDGRGLAGLADRAARLGGTVRLSAGVPRGSVLTARVPVGTGTDARPDVPPTAPEEVT